MPLQTAGEPPHDQISGQTSRIHQRAMKQPTASPLTPKDWITASLFLRTRKNSAAAGSKASRINLPSSATMAHRHTGGLVDWICSAVSRLTTLTQYRSTRAEPSSRGPRSILSALTGWPTNEPVPPSRCTRSIKPVPRSNDNRQLARSRTLNAGAVDRAPQRTACCLEKSGGPERAQESYRTFVVGVENQVLTGASAPMASESAHQCA
jgi:hypothetical protein